LATTLYAAIIFEQIKRKSQVRFFTADFVVVANFCLNGQGFAHVVLVWKEENGEFSAKMRTCQHG
jgi:hypothetical protein